MFGMIKFAIGLALLVMAFTVPLGKRTFAGHMQAIWSSEEGKDLRDGVNKKVDDFKSDDHKEAPQKAKKAPARKVAPSKKRAAKRPAKRRRTTTRKRKARNRTGGSSKVTRR